MKKMICILAALMMIWSVVIVPFPGAAGESLSFSVAGYDGDENGRDWQTNAFFQRWADRFGITLDLRQFTERDAWTKTKAAFSADEAMPDLLFKAELTVRETETLYQQGKIIDLRPLLEAHAPNLHALLQAHPAWAAAIALPDGAIPALPSINQLPNNNAIWINKKWLDNLGLPVPATSDALYDVLVAFRDSDPNQNGSRDEIPLTFSSMWDLRFLGHGFGIIANDYGVQLNEDGKAESVLGSAQQRAFLEWVHALWAEKLLDQNGFITSDQIRRITDEKATMTYGVLLGPTPLTLLPPNAMEQYQLLLPLSCGGQQQYRALVPEITRGTFAIAATCPHPEKALEMVDFLYGEEGARLAQAGLPEEDYQLNPDGTWIWHTRMETNPSAAMAQATIAEGGTAPGIISLDFQMAFEDAATHRLLTALSELKTYALLPYPQVWISTENQRAIDEIQLQLGAFAEESMVHFVTGEVPMADEYWAAYQAGLIKRGQAELTDIFNGLLPAGSLD